MTAYWCNVHSHKMAIVKGSKVKHVQHGGHWEEDHTVWAYCIGGGWKYVRMAFLSPYNEREYRRLGRKRGDEK